MLDSVPKIILDNQNDSKNSNNINKGKPIYLGKVLHYIVYEFEDNVLVSKNKDLSKVYCVKKSKTSINPTK